MYIFKCVRNSAICSFHFQFAGKVFVFTCAIWLIHMHRKRFPLLQAQIHRHRDHRSLAKNNPLSRLAISDRHDICREQKKVCLFFVSGHCTSHDSTSFSLGFLLKPAVQVSVSTQTPWKCRRRTITGKRVRRITYWVCLSKVIEFLTLFYPWSGLGLLTYSCL